MVVFLRSAFKCFSIEFHMARRLFQASGTFEKLPQRKWYSWEWKQKRAQNVFT